MPDPLIILVLLIAWFALATIAGPLHEGDER